MEGGGDMTHLVSTINDSTFCTGAVEALDIQTNHNTKPKPNLNQLPYKPGFTPKDVFILNDTDFWATKLSFAQVFLIIFKCYKINLKIFISYYSARDPPVSV